MHLGTVQYLHFLVKSKVVNSAAVFPRFFFALRIFEIFLVKSQWITFYSQREQSSQIFTNIFWHISLGNYENQVKKRKITLARWRFWTNRQTSITVLRNLFHTNVQNGYQCSNKCDFEYICQVWQKMIFILWLKMSMLYWHFDLLYQLVCLVLKIFFRSWKFVS